jgi:Fe-S-cluster containining protein
MLNSSYREEFINCRPGCGACCEVISISTPIPGMPDGKPAGVRCIHLNSNGLCALFGLPERPPVCSGFRAERAICGYTTQDAIRNISKLEGLIQNEL